MSPADGANAIAAAIMSNVAPGAVNLPHFNVMICFDLNTVARH